VADNLATTRVIDPIITTVARGYRNAMFAWPLLFPIATVQQRGGKILAFGTEDFVKRDLERAPGARRERLNVGYKGEDYALTQRALDGVLPKERLEEAEAVPGIALGRLTARKTMSSVFYRSRSSGLAGDHGWGITAPTQDRAGRQCSVESQRQHAG